MTEKGKIYSLDLVYNDIPAPFVIKKADRIDNVAIGAETVPHRHNYYSIIWPIDGTGIHLIDFREYKMAPDHLFFVNPMQVHQILIDSLLTAYVIMFTSEFLERNSIHDDFMTNLRLFRECDESPPLILNDKMSQNLMAFAQEMNSAFEKREDLFLDKVGAYLKLFLIECNSQCTIPQSSNLQNIEVTTTLVRGFKELVEKNYKTWHQVQNYADSLNVTANYLNEVIRGSLNTPAKEFIQKRIVLEAKRMVLFTAKSSKEVGYDLGFDDPSHFSKFFKTNTGQTIHEFKENNSA